MRVRQDNRAPFRVSLEPARQAAFPPGEYVGQESFMRAREIRSLARRAGIGPDVSVLDVCCGVAGPGRMLTAESGCGYLGIDYSAEALEIAHELAGDLPCRFERAYVPPLPDARFDVVLLLETMLAFRDKQALLREVARVLEPEGRFACTVETGRPLVSADHSRIPDADTVWLVEWAEFTAMLCDAGMTVIWQEQCTASHQATAAALARAFRADSARIADRIGDRALDDLIAAHELWCDWLGSGRVRKYALVAQMR